LVLNGVAADHSIECVVNDGEIGAVRDPADVGYFLFIHAECSCALTEIFGGKYVDISNMGPSQNGLRKRADF
jgi:hypothetical protein